MAAFMDGVETWNLSLRAQVMARVQRDAGIDVEAHLFPASQLMDADAASFAAHILRHGIRIPCAVD